MLSLEEVNEFKQIILEEYGIKLTDEQAYQDALAFLEMIKLLLDSSLIQKVSIDTQEGRCG